MNRIILGLVLSILLGTAIMKFFSTDIHAHRLVDVQTAADVRELFPSRPQEIKKLKELAIADSRAHIKEFLSIPDTQRTFENTAQALDELVSRSNAAIYTRIFQTIEMTNPDKAMRDTAHDAMLALQYFFVDEIAMAEPMFAAWNAYAQGNALLESLTPVQRYYIEDIYRDFKRSGMHLPAAQKARLKAVKKELAEVASSFESGIAQENRIISVPRQTLDGLDDDFINSLKKNEKGQYILGIDFPTRVAVMERCHVRSTRQQLWYQSNQRGYPKNKERLEHLITLRDELAQLLDYPSFAHYALDQQMVKSPDRAQDFLQGLLQPAQAKETIEFDRLKKAGIKNIEIAPDGKLYPWDVDYLKYQYKKNVINLDEKKVAEYFPMERTIKGLLSIYEKFFSLRFEKADFECPWVPDVTLLAVYNKGSKQLLGYFILDLYPRDNKYSHACHNSITPATYLDSDKPNKAVSIVIANFPKSTAHKPSLLTYRDVSTFFHEFGHALHALLGRQHLAGFAGTNTKLDFVEMPSQMLEEWLYDRDILHQLSSHYETAQPLPNQMIDAIITLKKFDSGQFVTTQVYYASLSLALFAKGAEKNIDAIQKDLFSKIRRNIIQTDDDHFYCSFGHLTEYDARYYGYLWSKVFALDLFDIIKHEGLLSPVAGKRYAQTILAPGGSKDPNEMLVEFLSREPNQFAFLRDLGLDSAPDVFVAPGMQPTIPAGATEK